MNANDLRVVKTRDNITKQLLSCLGEHSFEEVTVTMLVARAKINRTTFYRNYKDKYDLLDQVIGDVLAEFQSYLDCSFVMMRYAKASEYHPHMKKCVEYFGARRAVLTVLWKAKLPVDLYAAMETMMKDSLLVAMAQSYGIEIAEDSRANLYALLFAAITMRSLHWWLTCSPELSSREMLEILTANAEKGLFLSMEEHYHRERGATH